MNEENLKAIREKLSKEMEKSTENVADLDQNLLKEKLAEQETVAELTAKIKELESSLNR